MNRRQFLRAFGIGAGALAAAPLLPALPAPAPAALKFHPNAFQFVFDPPLGTSLRFIQHFDPIAAREVHRMDVLFGVAPMSDLQCPIQG